MAVLLTDMGFDTGNSLRQPASVRDRNHQVLDALPEERGYANLAQLEAPGLGEGDVVVAPARDALGKRAVVRSLPVLGAVAGQDRRVDRREDGSPDLLDLLGLGRTQFRG